MEGITAASDEVKDTVKSAGPAWHLERCPGHETKGCEPNNIRQVEVLERLIVWYVEKSAD
jgi:hypothetical protein